MRLDELVTAYGEHEADRDEPELADATRLRLRRSLAPASGIRRHVSAGVALVVLLVASAAWAIATGHLPPWQHAPEPAIPSAPVRAHAPPEPVTPKPAPVAVVEAPPVEDPPQHAVQRARVAAVAPLPPPLEREPLYDKAHDLHFHGTDFAAALVAWDAYLAAMPAGRFAIEARYNRALCLVRLGRLPQARDALLPFARGEIEPAGYRRVEAAALVDRIARRIGVSGSP
jgi:hypothetical protein